MIQQESYLNVADNSGARKIMCIRVVGGGNRRYGRVGDVIIGVVKDALPNMAVKRSDVVRAVIVRTKKNIRRSSGMSIRLTIMLPCSLTRKATLGEPVFSDRWPVNCETRTT